MGLLAPAMLALAAAALVPLLLHLLQRQQGPRVVFPALRYLHRAEKERARRIRYRQMLLLALRIAAIGLLALAAARPFLRAGGGAHPPTDVALILDNSASTAAVSGGHRVLAALKDRALQTLAAARSGDRFWLIEAGAPWRPAFTGTPAQVASRVREVAPTAAAANLPAAVARAQAVLAAGARGRPQEIELLSDLQATSFPPEATPGAGGHGAPVVAWSPAGKPPANAGITSLLMDGGFAPRAGERATVTAHVGGTAGGASDSVTARLFVEGRPVAAALVGVGGDVSLPLPPQGPGILTGRVEIDADALRTDDRRFFAAEIQPPPSVALLADAPFVDAALDVLAGAGRIRRAASGGGAVRIAPAAQGAEAVRAGATVVVLAPASPDRVAAVNARLASVDIPWRLGAAESTGETRLSTASVDPQLAAALAPARLHLTYPLQHRGPVGDDSVLLRLSDGAPWLVRGTAPAGGRYLIVGSPLDANASTLPTTAALVPLLDRILTRWAVPGAPVASVTAGRALALPAGATAVAGPDTQRVAVGTGERFRAEAPGVYRVLAGDSTLAVFAVNVPAAETPLARLAPRALAGRLSGHAVVLADDSAAWAHAIFRRRFGYQFWPVLLAAALLALLAEMWIAAGGGGVRRRAVETMTNPRTQS